MRLRRLARALRTEDLPTLVGEAAWRVVRSLRRSRFKITVPGDACPVHFHPIGYFRSQKQLVSEEARESLLGYADAILRGEFPLLGYGRPHLGTKPDWQCDWVSGNRWSLKDSTNMCLVRHDGSDVKAPWELSRLQWSPVVAKAYVLTGNYRYREALRALLTDWIVRNPISQGVNWTVAMEAAMRAISLCLTIDLLWPFTKEEKPWLDLMTGSLWQHLRFIEAHNEFSFLVRSNHYLSNLTGLTTLSAYLRGPGQQRRLKRYARAVQREVLLQTYGDGGDSEASTGYHVLVAQMGLHSFMVQQRSGCKIAPAFEARLRRMFAWIATLADDAGKLPHLGDCDNGRVELLPEDIAQAAQPACQRHSLRTGSLYALASHVLQLPAGAGEHAQKPISLLRESGLAVLRAGDASVVFSAMPNGLGGKGSHTHCDKLSFVLRLGVNEVFCDSGSRCYTRSADRRNLDRSTQAHNTLVIDGADQNRIPSDPQMLFQCGNEAAVSDITITEGDEISARASHEGYARLGIGHQRTVQLSEQWLLLTDEVSGAAQHALALRFVLGPEWRASSEVTSGDSVSCVIAGPRRVTLACETESGLALSILPVEISREYGAGLATSCILIHTTACLPAELRTRVLWD
jgi:Heparinase II/III-like protein/Heparinase II/III N-terminus